MITRIEITSTVFDTRSDVLRRRLVTEGFPIESVQLSDVYSIDAPFTPKQYQQIAGLLTDFITQKNAKPRKYSNSIEVGFLPGVTDNVGATAREMITDFFGRPLTPGEGIYSSRVIYLTGKLTKQNIRTIADSLYNPIIQRVWVDRVPDIVPKVSLSEELKAHTINIFTLLDRQLEEIGKRGINGPLALDLASMKAIQKHFTLLGRNPTDIELESIAQTWSEHCKHTIMNSPIDDIPEGLFNRYIRGATEKICRDPKKRKFCVSVFSDNSGAIDFDKTYAITHKVETHNSPSALDPFGGAITGIVGVNRDCLGFGLGAKPIMNMYGFCLGYPSDTAPLYRDRLRTQKMLSPRRIFDGVVAGINAGSNCSGIPTPTGFLYFDARYKGKPLVFAGTVGLIPKDLHEKNARPGDVIVMVGGRVGLDGIHGATFSSEALTSGSPATAVQIGDPITQKKLSDAIVKEARDLGLFTSITDNGAGGLSCSVAEMAKESGGCMVNLEKVPLKYPGLSPWQIWISESQERMTLSVPPKKWNTFTRLMKSRDVEATQIGTFTKSGKCIVRYNGKTIMDLDLKFLHDGQPVRHLKTRIFHPKGASLKNGQKSLLTLLRDPNFSGFSFLSSQYDYEVQGTSALKPLQGRGQVNADATVLRPLLTSNKGFVSSCALYPGYSDTYEMTAAAIDTAIRNVVAAGADPDRIALLDNFCWTESHRPDRLWQLKRAAQACYDRAIFWGTPFISGKDSMFNDFHGFDSAGKSVSISIPPTVLICAIGIIDDVQKSVSLDTKMPGDCVYVLSGQMKKFYHALHLIASAQSVHHGGLVVALAKTAIGGQLGLEVSVKDLFSEEQGRIVVTVSPQNKKEFERVFHTKSIGTITNDRKITINNVVHATVKEATDAYRSTFKDF